MFSTIPVGDTPVSNSSVRSLPFFSNRTSAEKPASPIRKSGTPSGANCARTRAVGSVSTFGQLSRVTGP